GLPFVLKTARFGYDGKGQTVIRTEEQFQAAIERFEPTEYVAEQWLPFDQEISVIVTRSATETRVFPVSENIHRENILHLSIVPARISESLEQEAIALAESIADAVGLIGTLAIELFVVGSRLIVNELAPRPHNSGHYSIDACETSQFEQHIRAISGLPLGDTRLTTPVVMANILGQHVTALYEELPRLSARTKVHLYGKAEAKTGRKMGHLNILADTVDDALAEVERLSIWKETVQ
ncbi:MAG: ATP-grasp domain-containing protein, partial [Exiguobacterium sp.]